MSFLKLNRNILDNPKICYLSQRKVILKLPSTFDILPKCNIICNLDLTNFTLGCSPAPPPAPVGPPPERLFGMKASDIDKYSRVVFPIAFLSFHLMYWMIYLTISNEVADDLVYLQWELYQEEKQNISDVLRPLVHWANAKKANIWTISRVYKLGIKMKFFALVFYKIEETLIYYRRLK